MSGTDAGSRDGTILVTQPDPRLGRTPILVRIRFAGARFTRRHPFSVSYVVILSSVTAWLYTVPDDMRDSVAQAASTNLHNLSTSPVVLLTSAVVVSGPSLIWPTRIAVLLLLVEHLLGTVRAAAVFVAGHIGATLLVAAGLLIALAHGVEDDAVRNAQDTGVSYAGMALAGGLAVALCGSNRQLKKLGLAVLVVALVQVIDPLIRNRSFTDVGHAYALVLGTSCAWLTTRRRRLPRAEPPVTGQSS